MQPRHRPPEIVGDRHRPSSEIAATHPASLDPEPGGSVLIRQITLLETNIFGFLIYSGGVDREGWLDLRQLRAFVAVAREGTFERAAAALGASQPAVSLALRDLQAELEVRLIERAGRGTRLTAAGRALLERAGPLLAEWKALPAALADAAGEPGRGTVRVGAGEGAALYLLPGPVRALRSRFPACEVVVRSQPPEETLAMLKAGDLDFGVRSLRTPPAGIAYRPWQAFDRVLVARQGHPILAERRVTLPMLARHPWVMPSPRSTTRQLVEHALGAKGLPCRIAAEAGGWEVVKRYARVGLGIAVVPAFCVRGRDRQGLGLRSVTGLFGRDAYGILVREGRPLTPLAQALVDRLERR
jgi:DNA-binding transcriptional LysR family regulator